MTQIFDNTIAEVKAAFPSVYTKEDVIKLLMNVAEQVRETSESEITPEDTLEMLEELKESVMNAVRNIDFADMVSLELNPYDNRIDIDVDQSKICKLIGNALDESVDSITQPSGY